MGSNAQRRNSDNMTRQAIFRIVKNSEFFLTKITNAEDILRRISVVLTSNDHIARALTLRSLQMHGSNDKHLSDSITVG